MLYQEIVQKLRVKKDTVNEYSKSKFKYRNIENIFEMLKPLLGDSILLFDDELVLIGDRYYVKSIVTLNDGKGVYTGKGFARESLQKTDMDDAQVTGSATTYARKYAISALFLLDNGDDPDGQDNSKIGMTIGNQNIDMVLVGKIDNANIEELRALYRENKGNVVVQNYIKTKISK